MVITIILFPGTVNGFDTAKHCDGESGTTTAAASRGAQQAYSDGNTATGISAAAGSSTTGGKATGSSYSTTSSPLRQRLPSQAGLTDLSSANPGIFVGGIGGSNIYSNNIQTPSTFSSSNLGVNYPSVGVSGSSSVGGAGAGAGHSGSNTSSSSGNINTGVVGGGGAQGTSGSSSGVATSGTGGCGIVAVTTCSTSVAATGPRRQGSFTNVFSKIIDGMPAGTMFSKFKNVSTPVVQQTVIDGNPIKQYFDIGKAVACAGPELAWKIHEGHRKNDGKVSAPVTMVWVGLGYLY